MGFLKNRKIRIRSRTSLFDSLDDSLPVPVPNSSKLGRHGVTKCYCFTKKHYRHYLLNNSEYYHYYYSSTRAFRTLGSSLSRRIENFKRSNIRWGQSGRSTVDRICSWSMDHGNANLHCLLAIQKTLRWRWGWETAVAEKRIFEKFCYGSKSDVHRHICYSVTFENS